MPRRPLVIHEIHFLLRLLMPVIRLWRGIGLALRKPLLPWVRPRVAPENAASQLQLDSERPVCYVLVSRSLADFVVVQRSCREQGLPVPHLTDIRLPTPARSSCVFMPPRHERSTGQLDRLIKRAVDREDFDAQIVPVALYWGRDPDKETSMLRVLFTDNPLAGSILKFFIVLFNGRNSFVHFGQPISVREFLASMQQADPALSGQKLKRVLRIHFARERIATLGPSRSRRTLVMHSLLGAPGVQRAMREQASHDNLPLEKLRATALEYADEIAADLSSATVRFLDLVLSWALPRFLDGGIKTYHVERLRRYARDQALVYMPAHRSHFDYLLVSLSIYHQGLALPHIAAGINMNFWPLGIMLRRGGAFYLRRSFSGNRLYTEVFRAYVDQLLGGGHAVEFFPEGTRSRTGRMMPPKTGMLSMVVQSFLRNPDQRVALVPVHLAYDKVLEVNSYFKELSGDGKKKNESVGGLVKASSSMKKGNGCAYLAFGPPLELQQWIDNWLPDWRERLTDGEPDSQTPWLQALVSELAADMTRRTNASSTLTATALVAMLLLASPKFALDEQELLNHMEHVLGLLQAVPYSDDVNLPAEPVQSLLSTAERVGQLQRVAHPWGDVLAAQGRTAVLLTYARNTALHLLALPALLARFFKNHDALDEATVVARARGLYPFLRSELYLPWGEEAVEQVLHDYLDALVQRGLLTRAGGQLRRPDIATPAFASLVALGRIMRPTLERLGMTTLLLSDHIGAEPLQREQFEAQCRLMAERIGVLSGLNSPEFFDKALFRNYVETLKRQQLLQVQADQSGEQDEQPGELLQVSPELRQISEESLDLVDPDVLHSILRAMGRPRPLAETKRRSKS